MGLHKGGLISSGSPPTAGTAQTALSYTATAASGADGFIIANNGARVHFGAGASDYASSDGTTITFAGPIATAGSLSFTGVQSMLGTRTDADVTIQSAITVANAVGNGAITIRTLATYNAGDMVLALRNGAGGTSIKFSVDGAGFVRGGGLYVGTTSANAVLALSGVAPTIAAGFGTGPAVAGTSTAFTITIGTGGTDSTGTITLPTATTGWIVQLTDVTNNASFVTSQTGGNTTTATVQNYSRTTGLPIAWTAGDVLRCTAVAY